MGTETAEERRRRYVSSSQDEVSNPDEWADVQFGHLDSEAYERMLAYSRANRIRLQRAATRIHAVSCSKISAFDIGLHPFSCVNIPNAAVATLINRTHCSLATLLERRTLLTSLSSLVSSMAIKRPISLPRNLRLSELNLFVLRSPGFSFVLILWIVKIPALSKLCKKNCLICTCFNRPVPAR